MTTKTLCVISCMIILTTGAAAQDTASQHLVKAGNVAQFGTTIALFGTAFAGVQIAIDPTSQAGLIFAVSIAGATYITAIVCNYIAWAHVRKAGWQMRKP